MSNGNFKICPYCCEKISSLATKCQYCGQFLSEEDTKINDAICPICHEAISSSDLKCEHCNSIISPTMIRYSKGQKTKNNSGMTESTIVPEKVKGWSWGAFVFVWLWGIPNKSFLTLFTLIPYAGILWRIFCGVKAKEWAWQNNKWDSVEEFNRIQKIWDISGILTILAIVAISVALCLYESKHPGTILNLYIFLTSIR
jgi:hypothetical protein